MLYIEHLEQLLRHEICELFTLVCDDFKRQAKAANPPIKNRSGNCKRLFVRYGYKLDVFCECIGKTQNKLFIPGRSL